MLKQHRHGLRQHTEAENLMVYEIPERVPGSFFTEAEEGTLTDMNIGTGEDASDGKYIAAREEKCSAGTDVVGGYLCEIQIQK